MDAITYLYRPRLHQPLLIVGFEGWPNAGEVSSYSIQYLVQQFKAKHFASIPLDPFYQTSSLRPTAIIKDGKLLELKPPANHFYFAKRPPSHDLILFSGTEPHLQWSRFAELFLDLAERYGVSQIVSLGGTYDYVPHTRPPVVSALFNHEDLKEKVLQSGLRLTDYSGPISIHTYIQETAREKGIKAITLWGHAPQYLQAKNLRVAHSVLQHLNALTGMEVDLSPLEKAGEYFDQQVNHLIEQDPKLQEVIHKLEEIYQQNSTSFPFAKKQEDAKEDKVIYIKAFLKRQEDEENKES